MIRGQAHDDPPQATAAAVGHEPVSWVTQDVTRYARSAFDAHGSNELAAQYRASPLAG